MSWRTAVATIGFASGLSAAFVAPSLAIAQETAELRSDSGADAKAGDIELDPDLALCDAPASAAAFERAVTGLAKRSGAALDPNRSGAVRAASDLAARSTTLREQLDGIEPAHAAFVGAWERFDELATQTGMAHSDRILRMFLPAYRRNVDELGGLVGCNDEPEVGAAVGASLCPCPAIPLAHQLAELALQLHTYVADRYSEPLPDAVPAAHDLDHAAASLHDLLHAIEITIPEMQLAYETLTGEVSKNSAPLTEIDVAFERLDPLLGRCSLDPEASMAPAGEPTGESSDATHGDHTKPDDPTH